MLLGMCNSTHRMADELLSTAAVARRLGVSVATVNRWAGGAAERPLEPAQTLPGNVRAAGHLYRSQDVEDAWDRRVVQAIRRGACEACTSFTVQVWHNGDPCPNEAAA